jgi:acyl-CoA thioesterase I
MTSGHKVLNIFFFGDSICFGQRVSVHLGWVTRIAKKINVFSRPYKIDIIVTNSSINGSTSRQALERMPHDIQAGKPDILIVQFGMNDCNCWETDHGLPRVSPAGFASNLEEIISRARAFSVSEFFLLTNHPSTRNKGNMPYTDITYQDHNSKYNEIIRNVAKATRISLIDTEKYWYEQLENGLHLEDLLLPDEVHLSVRGHNLYYNFVYPYIEMSVKKLTSGPQELI